MTRTVLVTGASRGIGLKISKELSSASGGFDRVVMVMRPSDAFQSAFEEVRASSGGCDVVAIEADLNNPARLVDVYDQLDTSGVQVNIIVNNAGHSNPTPIVQTDLDDFETTLRVNVLTPFKLVKLALERKHPLTQIINIASTAGMNGRSGWLSYSASKAALINMSEVMREELGPQGVDVVCLSPGRCATDLRSRLAPDEDPSSIMQPEQVATIVQMMTTETGKLLHSQNIVVRT
jgi:3-oxoacyl-[acyl-carrier protein] reductase